MRISPRSGDSNPATHLRRVVFPEPLAPTMTKNSPSATWSSKPFSADTLPSLTVNCLVRPRMEIMGLRSEEHTSELQSLRHLVCRLLLEKKKTVIQSTVN